MNLLINHIHVVKFYALAIFVGFQSIALAANPPSTELNQVVQAIVQCGGDVNVSQRSLSGLSINITFNTLREPQPKVTFGLKLLPKLSNCLLAISDLISPPFNEASFSLTLVGPGISDGILEPLKGLGNLRELSLDRSSVTNAGIRNLSGLNLNILRLSRNGITDVGISNLDMVKNIKYLELISNKFVTGSGFNKLTNLTMLQEGEKGTFLILVATWEV